MAPILPGTLGSFHRRADRRRDDGGFRFDPVISRESYLLTVGTAVTDSRDLPAVVPREVYVGEPVDVTFRVPAGR